MLNQTQILPHLRDCLLINRANVELNHPCEYAVEKVLHTHQMVIQITSRCRKGLNRELCIAISFYIIYKYM